MNKILETIKKELKEGEVLENIDIESVEEVQEYEINKPRNRKMKGSLLKKGALTLALAMALNGPIIQKNNDNISIVEAATKDKKKPKITMKGKSKITVNQNEAIKLGKVTAKDNIDGNVTKKITVKVTKGKKNYSSIARKVKSNKKIKFTAEGKYVITYTVKDAAGNKTTKKRYITVKPVIKTVPTEEKTQELITTQQPIVEVPTTEIPTRTIEPTTEEQFQNITTEELTTEVSTTEKITEQLTTQARTEVPTTEKITEQLTTQTRTEVPTTEKITEQLTTQARTEVPTTERITEQLTTQARTEVPTTEKITEQPTTQTRTEAPTTEKITEQPTTQARTEVPTTEKITEQPTTQARTEVPTTERITEQLTTQARTEVPTTERITEQLTTQVSTEVPTTEKNTEFQPYDLSEYGTIEQIQKGDYTYNVLIEENSHFLDESFNSSVNPQSGILNFSKYDIKKLLVDSTSEYINDYNYLELMGNLNLVDTYGVDVSENVFFYEFSRDETHIVYQIFFINSKNEFNYLKHGIVYFSIEENKNEIDWNYIDEENQIYIKYNENTSFVSMENLKKKLKKID